MSSFESDPELTPKMPSSTLSTPGLTGSLGPSPALQRIKTPDEELPAFDLGRPALEDDHLWVEGVRVPECWGHRGASASYRMSHSTFSLDLDIETLNFRKM